MVEVRSDRTFEESAASGALTIEVNADGVVVRCQIEPEVNATWAVDMLTDRIKRLHRLALMRARCAQRIAWNGLVDPSQAYPTQTDIDEYRRTIDF